MIEPIVRPSIQPLALTSCELRQQLGQDAVLGRRIGGGAEADDGVGQQRVAAEQHHQAADHLDRVRDEHHRALGHGVGEGADEAAPAPRRTARTSAPAPGSATPAPGVFEQFDRSNQQRVVGQRAEELRRHDGVETFFHSSRAAVIWPGRCLPALLSVLRRRVIARELSRPPAGAEPRLRGRAATGRIAAMPRPIEALVHRRRPGAQPGAGARRGARRAGLGGGQGQRLRPRHRARLRRPARRRRLRAARPGRGRARARASAGAGRSCCSKAASSRATSSCARA